MINLDEGGAADPRPENAAEEPKGIGAGTVQFSAVSAPTGPRSREELERRRDELLAMVRKLGGIHGGAAPGFPLEMEVAFLERVVAFETAPRTSNRGWLAAGGLHFRSPAELSGTELERELGRLIKALARARVFLSCTDHLTDAELYQALWERVLPAEVADAERTEDDATHWDFSEEEHGGPDTWLRWYASEEQRLDWSMEFPEEPMPRAEKRPARRDHRLPRPHPDRGGVS